MSRVISFSLAMLALLGHVSPAASQSVSTPRMSADPELIDARSAADRTDWARAEFDVRQSLRTRGDSPEALYLLGSILFHEDKPKDSLLTYTHAAQLARPSAVDFRTIALDYVLLNDYADAEKWITRAARENPADGDTWYAMGRIKYTQNRFADAVASFQHALERMPRSIKAENNLGLAYEGLNQPEDAIKAYRQALEWQKGDPHPSEQPFLNLGILLTDRNQFDEALNLLKQAEAIAPKDPKIHGAVGKLYARRNDLPQAQAELEQAVAGTPRDSALHFQLGQVYRKEGMTERAAAELKLAADLEKEQRH